MSQLWKWLARANARAVFVSAAVALALVVGWWLWKEFMPSNVKLVIPGSVAKDDVSPDLGVLAFLRAEHDRGLGSIGDPFSGPARPKPVPIPTKPQPTPVPAPAATAGNPTPQSTPTVAPAPQVAARTVTLSYRGSIVRPDGRTVAVIEEPSSGHSGVFTNGAVAFGVRIANIGLDGVDLRQPGGSNAPLAVGKSGVFVEGTDGL